MLAWILFGLYLIGTSYLGWLGHRKTDGFSSFAIGKGDLSPLVVGITLAASTASAATFIINPGFVYVDGLAAFMHLGIAVYLGFLLMLWILSFQFRRLGDEMGALTIPDWIGKRYGSKAFSLYFSVLNLLGFAFVVLLVGGISIVMQSLLGISNVAALLITLVFVTSYVFLGGTYAHVFTNMLQGSLMIGVSLLIVGSGIWLMIKNGSTLMDNLQEANPHLLSWINPDGKLFNNFFSIYVAGFCIGAALVCQPHILTKALYVKTDKAVKQYIGVFTVVYFLFTLLLLTGFWAHLVVPDELLNDPQTGQFRQDLVMTAYLQEVFPDWVFTVISIVLLAAAMSTLDGLLVGISTITANDLVLPVLDQFRQQAYSHAEKMRLAFRASHLVLILIAVFTFWIDLNPPKLLGIFGQVGVYGLVLAAVPPLLVGVLFKKVSLPMVWLGSLLSMGTHFSLYFLGEQLFPNSSFTFSNPGVTAALGILVGLSPTLVGSLIYKNSKT